MIYPPCLKKGDLIGICAPSAGVGHKLESFDRSLSVLHAEGYRTRETESVRLDSDRGGSAMKRGEELMDLFRDPDVKMVMAASGGDFLDEMLPFTDFAFMRKNPRWLMGASDPTGLLFPYTTLCDVATLYGNNAGSYDILAPEGGILCGNHAENSDMSAPGEGGASGHSKSAAGEAEDGRRQAKGMPGQPGDYLRDSLAFLKGKPVIQRTSGMHLGCPPFMAQELKYDTPTAWQATSRSIHVSGRCIGGCIDVLKDLIGTPYDGAKDFVARYGARDGIIWYFDNFALSAEVLYRTCLQMKYAGWFEHTRAVLFGRTLFEKSESGMTYGDAVRMAFGGEWKTGKVAEEYPGTGCGQKQEEAGTGCGQRTIPVIWEADIGHTIPHMTMINGAMLSLDYEDGKGTLRFSLI